VTIFPLLYVGLLENTFLVEFNAWSVIDVVPAIAAALSTAATPLNAG